MAGKHISTGKRFCAPLPIIFSARKQINTSTSLFSSVGPTLLNNSLGGNSVYRWDSVSKENVVPDCQRALDSIRSRISQQWERMRGRDS